MTANPDRACPHEDFAAVVEVNRLSKTDGAPIDAYVLVRGTLDVHEALRAWADELDDGVIYDGYYDCVGTPRAGIDADDWEPEPKDVVAFGDHVHEMIRTASVRYYRIRPGTKGDREDGYAWWLEYGTQGRRGSFPGVWFS